MDVVMSDSSQAARSRQIYQELSSRVRLGQETYSGGLTLLELRKFFISHWSCQIQSRNSVRATFFIEAAVDLTFSLLKKKHTDWKTSKNSSVIYLSIMYRHKNTKNLRKYSQIMAVSQVMRELSFSKNLILALMFHRVSAFVLSWSYFFE